MELKHDEKVTLDNFKAHYEVILGNIRIANEKLEKALLAEKSANDSVAKLTARIQALSSEVGELQDRRDQVVRETEKRISVVTEREVALNKQKTDTSEYVETQLSRLEEERVSLDATIASKKQELEQIDQRLAVLNDSVRVTSAQVESLSSRVSSLSTEVAALDRSKAAFENEIAAIKESHDRQKKEMLAEIADIQRITQEEKDKMIMSEDFYKKKDEEYARRERDILIVTKRLKTLFNELKPGSNLKI